MKKGWTKEEKAEFEKMGIPYSDELDDRDMIVGLVVGGIILSSIIFAKLFGEVVTSGAALITYLIVGSIAAATITRLANYGSDGEEDNFWKHVAFIMLSTFLLGGACLIIGFFMSIILVWLNHFYSWLL